MRTVRTVALVVAAALLAGGCSSEEGGDKNDGTLLSVTFLSPTAGQVFTAEGTSVDIPAEVNVVGLPKGAQVEMLLDDVVRGPLGEDRTFTYSGVALGLRTLEARAIGADGAAIEGASSSHRIQVVVTGPCTTAADCDDEEVCTEDLCGSSGTCEYLDLSPDCEPISGVDCETDADCEAVAEKLGPCQQAPCNQANGKCDIVSLADGSPCDDGDACTTTDKCQGGECTPGAAESCDDSDPCTADACNAETGCTNVDNGTCDCTTNADCADLEDGDLCNGTYACDDGKCEIDPATIPSCSGEVTGCEVNACNPATGGCALMPVEDGTECNDDDPCTEDDACLGGECQGTAPDCDDGNPCTQDVCNPLSGCSSSPVFADCDDGDPCTVEDACSGGTCAGIPMDCDDGNPCTANACDAGECTKEPIDGPCDDGSVCTAGDTCQGGDCVGPAINGDDGNPCTDESCDPLTGVLNVPNTNPCSDGNACTIGDVCGGGVCNPGATKPCNDNNDCTVDTCNSETGDCASQGTTGGACNDNNACTSGDKCNNGQCEGTPINGDDEDACTADACNPETGVTNTLITCDDSNPCTFDDCSPATGCTFTPQPGIACDDQNPCTSDDVCNAAGQCKGSGGPDCNDSNPCTTDTCSLAAGCIHTNNAATCDDGNACTTGDKCSGGACIPGTALVCNDNNPCTTDSCVPATGCATAPTSGNACNDGNACTTSDTCQNGTCAGTAVVCNDSNPCTTDGCNPANGACTSVPAGAIACNDNNACTTGDTCQGSTCTGAQVACNDGNPCTIDACNQTTGCKSAPTTGACNDGNACTVNDTCAAGTCSGSALVCNDSNPCTNDSCSPATGCVYTNNTLPCDDSDSCTLGDTCSGGKCMAGPPDPLCPSPLDSVCVVSGAAGTELVCSLLLARATQATPLPAALQFNLHFDPVAMQTLKFQDEFCITEAGPCFMTDVPPTPLYPSGHTMSISPDPVSSWSGKGTVILANVSNPKSPITTAYFDAGGNLIGDAKFVELVVKLNVGISAAAAKHITAKQIVAASESAEPLTGTVSGGVIVVSGGPVCKSDSACNDNVACTTDKCNTSTGVCSNTPDSTKCTDGKACTLDTCDPVKGCVFKEDDTACTDGQPCTQDLCDASQGCIFLPISEGQACNDGNACTTGEKCTAGVCGGGTTIVCDDGNDCTSNQCDTKGGCVFPQQNGTPCDDGNSCTSGDQCAAGACKPGNPVGGPLCPTPGQNVICELWGAKDQEVTCLLSLAAASQASPPATGLQFTMAFESLKLQFVNFYDTLCFAGVGCFSVPVAGPGSSPMSTGHSISIGPSTIAGWNATACSAGNPCAGGKTCTEGLCEGTGGYGGVVIVNVSDPSKAISPAYVAPGGAIVNDPVFVEARFKLRKDVPAGTPSEIKLASMLGADKTSQALDVIIVDFIMISSKP